MHAIKEAQDKLCDKLINTGWLSKLRLFVRSSDFEDLLLSLSLELEENRRFTPGLNDIFRCFETTSYEETNVVFVVSEPWTNPLLNTGLALSTTDIKDTPGLYTFLAEIQADLGSCGIEDGDLRKIARQGVLLLNTSLTTQIQEPGKHEEIWESFMNYLWDVLNRKDNLILVFFGNSSYIGSSTNETHIKIIVPALPESKIQKWESNNLFSTINNHLETKGKIKIIW